MKKLLVLSIGILLSVTSFSQVILNVEKDLTVNTEGDTISHELVYQSAIIEYTGRSVIIQFNDHINKEFTKVKFKFIGFDQENPKAWIAENDEVGRIRIEHDIIAYTAKIEFKQENRIMILN